MIIYYNWIEKKKRIVTVDQLNCDGWYLFGIIPLYVRKYIRQT